MSFGNVPRDYFSADIRTVGSLLQYQRSPGVWVTAASLTGNVYTLPAEIQKAQLSLSFDGTVLAIGLATPAAGSVLSILTNTAGFYAQKVIPLPPDNVGVTYGSVSLSDNGKILAVGSGSDNGDVGAVWIYAYVAGVWTLQGTKITGPGEIGLGNFGQEISLSGAGNLLAVGSLNDGTSGAVYIFNLSFLSSPLFVARLVGSPISPGAVFGWDVAFSADGSTLAVGASADLAGKGSAFIFTKVQGQWLQQAYFTAPPEIALPSFFGNVVSLSADGNILVVSSNANAVVYYRQGLTGPWSAGILLPLPYDLVDPLLESFAIISHDGSSICFSYTKNNSDVGASCIFSQGPSGTWIQTEPGFVGAASWRKRRGPAAESPSLLPHKSNEK